MKKTDSISSNQFIVNAWQKKICYTAVHSVTNEVKDVDIDAV